MSVHPYIPNSTPTAKQQMLDALGLNSVDDIYKAIPAHLRLNAPLTLPPPAQSEAELTRTLETMLARNTSCSRRLSFLGGGCWQHYVPAVCDEINQRAEFLTAYGGEGYSDHGKYQAFFEFASLLGELIDLEAVALSTYDWGNAAGSALRMASRITGRRVVLCPRATGPERLATIRTLCEPDIIVNTVPFQPDTLLLDTTALQDALSGDVAAVYVEMPSYLGVIDTAASEIAQLAHAHGALFVVGVDPSSLGVLATPPSYGADIVCGELQPLGMHMSYGGGLAGFVATPDEPQYIHEHSGFMIGVAPTSSKGELGFGYLDFDRTLYIQREEGKDFTGTATGLWAITAAVYLSLMGPQGMQELGRGIMQRSHFAARCINEIPGVRAPAFSAPYFKEFVVSFDETTATVDEVNRSLRDRGIFGGHDLSRDFPELGQSALYSVTEIHTRNDIAQLTDALADITQSRTRP
jgi:glycine dehydrogenase subunit 1